jgi:hypothetical protein
VKQLQIQSSAFVMATYATRKSKNHKMSEGPRFPDPQNKFVVKNEDLGKVKH